MSNPTATVIGFGARTPAKASYMRNLSLNWLAIHYLERKMYYRIQNIFVANSCINGAIHHSCTTVVMSKAEWLKM